MTLNLHFEGVSLSIEENKRTIAELQIRELCVIVTKHAFDSHIDITLSDLAFKDCIRSQKEDKDVYFIISRRLTTSETIETLSSKQLIYISIDDISRSSPLLSSVPNRLSVVVDCGPLSCKISD